MFVRWTAALSLVTLLSSGAWAPNHPYLHAPSVETYAVQDPAGRTILSNGRYITPAGRHTPVGSMPYGLAMSRDGNVLFVASKGVGQIVTGWRDAKPTITSVKPPPRKKGAEKESGTNAGGADFSPDGRTLYWSSGDTGAVYVIDTSSPDKTAEISLNVALGDRKFEDSYAVDVKVSGDGRFLYCADVTNFRVAVIDTTLRQMIGSAPVGRYPYALAVAGDRVYVANIGLFEYSAIPPPKTGGFDPRGLTFPPFGYPSREARDGVEVEGRKVPGLGEANVPESF
jgi:sugar lactone lactonase YvrE